VPVPGAHPARVDAHAHLHPRFDAARFLDAAARNAGGTAVLCLTESAGVRRFDELRATGRAGAWTITPTDEPESIVATRAHETVALLAGRQVITSERLEVLALATPSAFNDGRPLDETIDTVLGAGALAVLPWGFGKWWGARGKLAIDALRAHADRGILIGDNAGRPRRTPDHRVFKLARELGVPCLPGTDPLDLDHHLTRAGSYGFELGSPLDERTPGADLRERVRARRASPPAFGRRVSLGAFVRDQAMLRLAKRKAASA